MRTGPESGPECRVGCGVSFPVSFSPGRIPATTYGTLERRARSRAFSASVSSRVTLMLAAGRRSACSRAVRTMHDRPDRGPDRRPRSGSRADRAERASGAASIGYRIFKHAMSRYSYRMLYSHVYRG